LLIIRLARRGRKNQPEYSVVLAEKSSPVKSKFLEDLGYYKPSVNPPIFEIKKERILYWLQKGSSMSNTIARLSKKAGIKEAEKFIVPYAKQKKKSEEEKK
jgi:small subunit ribosomal protein S16